jgi:hypothetical protein
MKLGGLRTKWDALRAKRDEFQARWEDFSQTQAFSIGFAIVFAVVFVGGIIWTTVRPEKGWWSDGSVGEGHHVHVHAPHAGEHGQAHEQAEPPHEPPPRAFHMP